MDTRSAKRNYCIQQWKSIIQDRYNSGMTVDAYCKQNGISRHLYFYWLPIIREEALNHKTSSEFVELSVQADSDLETSRFNHYCDKKPDKRHILYYLSMRLRYMSQKSYFPILYKY